MRAPAPRQIFGRPATLLLSFFRRAVETAGEPGARSVFDERAEAGGVPAGAQAVERLGLDLPDALARQPVDLAHLLEGVLVALLDAEAQAQDPRLARGQERQRAA